MTNVLLAVLILIIIVLGGFQIFGNTVYGCQLNEQSIDFMLLRRFRVWRLRYEDIAEVRPIKFYEMFSLGDLPFGFIGKPFGKFVALRRKSGLLKVIVVTPDLPETFVSTIQQRLTNGRN
jgi:hypothetical protein